MKRRERGTSGGSWARGCVRGHCRGPLTHGALRGSLLRLHHDAGLSTGFPPSTLQVVAFVALSSLAAIVALVSVQFAGSLGRRNHPSHMPWAQNVPFIDGHGGHPLPSPSTSDSFFPDPACGYPSPPLSSSSAQPRAQTTSPSRRSQGCVCRRRVGLGYRVDSRQPLPRSLAELQMDSRSGNSQDASVRADERCPQDSRTKTTRLATAR